MDDSRIAPNPAPTPSRPEQGIGLVLAGGGAKGGYQIGVWRTLREMGIDRLVTGVAGASVGAINAALFAWSAYDAAEQAWRAAEESDFLAPLPGSELAPRISNALQSGASRLAQAVRERFDSAADKDAAGQPISEPGSEEPAPEPWIIDGEEVDEQTALQVAAVLNRSISYSAALVTNVASALGKASPQADVRYKHKLLQGLYSPVKLRAMMERALPERSPRPVQAFASVYDTVDEKALYLPIPDDDKERVIEVALASACMPGIYGPMRLDGRICCDGGVGDNRPIQALYERGWRRFIVVYLDRASSDETRANLEHDRSAYPDAVLVPVVPGDAFNDSFVGGTMNVSPKANASRIAQGYEESARQFSVLRLFPELGLG